MFNLLPKVGRSESRRSKGREVEGRYCGSNQIWTSDIRPSDLRASAPILPLLIFHSNKLIASTFNSLLEMGFGGLLLIISHNGRSFFMINLSRRYARGFGQALADAVGASAASHIIYS